MPANKEYLVHWMISSEETVYAPSARAAHAHIRKNRDSIVMRAVATNSCSLDAVPEEVKPRAS